jgi:phenylacetate-coenzyme A ligase PaaK-like adenylate-forming protein
MKLDFSQYPVSGRGYSERPMAFLDIAPGKILGGIVELALIETGSSAARARWHKTQLRNLLAHASQRSSFWRGRIGAKQSGSKLGALPVLTRAEVRQQVAQEGSLLLPTDGLQTFMHGTSGSSGIPVEFHLSQMNVYYNIVRYLAQEFMDGKDLSMNHTHIKTARVSAVEKLATIPCGFTVEKKPTWLGDIGSVFASGELKYIECISPVLRDLMRELRKDPVGRLVTNPRILSSIISHFGVKLLRELHVSEFLSLGEAMDPDLYQAILDQGIRVRSSYSSEEVGPIGFECEAMPGYYHVATSNVIVEVEGSCEIDGKKLGRVLVTHLHSYATPFIRYDLGDLALLAKRCPCGHAGTTIYSLHGRVTNAIKHRDGTLTQFLIRGDELREIITFAEFRIRQVGFDSIVVEIGGRETLTPEEIANVTAFLQARAGDKFKIDVIARPAIHWGDSIKRQSFRCEV